MIEQIFFKEKIWIQHQRWGPVHSYDFAQWHKKPKFPNHRAPLHFPNVEGPKRSNSDIEMSHLFKTVILKSNAPILS